MNDLTTCLLNSRMSRRKFCCRPDYACEASKTWNDQHVLICFHDRTLHILYCALLDDFAQVYRSLVSQLLFLTVTD